MDELAEIAGEDPVSYRLSLLSDPRARRVVETAAQMSGWFENRDRGDGTARGFGFARYKNIAVFCGGGGRSRGRRGGAAASGSGAAPMPAW